jgi:hypothetical protein
MSVVLNDPSLKVDPIPFDDPETDEESGGGMTDEDIEALVRALQAGEDER